MHPNLKRKAHDVYAIVTNRIIEYLEQGIIPWRQPWTEAGHPMNLISKKNYRGINVWLLNSLHYEQNYFLSFKQVKELGGRIKKGERGQEVVFWKWVEKENLSGKTETIPFLRFYHVFNIAQTEGIPPYKLPLKETRINEPIQTCEQILANMPNRPDIRFEEHRAYYQPRGDFINMPKKESFESSERFYSVLFHELIHSTGAECRLNRPEVTKNRGFGTQDYAIEELTAEIGASYLKSFAGIPIEKLDNNAAYIQAWLRKLKEDKRLLVYASSKAQLATDYILKINEYELEFKLQYFDHENKKYTMLNSKDFNRYQVDQKTFNER